jgi:SpoVK/Ycf46/Vps4 family AAA+-type ATPase
MGAEMSDPLIESMRAAVAAAPNDTALRIHFAELLTQRGMRDEAIQQAATVLATDPSNVEAMRLLQQPRSLAPSNPPLVSNSGQPAPDEQARRIADLAAQVDDALTPKFDETQQLGDAYEVQDPGIRLADVGGMQQVKERLEASLLAPLKNPELVRLYGKTLRGGLLLYGPPGCGKTFIARALAGEIGAKFLTVSLADVLDMFLGQSERNVHELFELARRSTPCVLFLDEIDALGQKRSNTRNSAIRGTVNQLLSEMDGVANANDGVYVLGATNHPWDVDVALRRPGRFDRTVLVLPPDLEARAAIFNFHLKNRPIENISTTKLAKLTDGYSGADIAYVCEGASERVLLDSVRTGNVRLIGMDDLLAAIKDTKPSVRPWLEVARNVAQFANEGGVYDELLTYLRSQRLA